MKAQKESAESREARNNPQVDASLQSGASGGEMARDIAARDEEKAATGGDPKPSRATKQDKLQPDTGTRSDHKGAQGKPGDQP